MSKYHPIHDFLRYKNGPVEVSFSSLADLGDGGLPASAYRYGAWWAQRPDPCAIHVVGLRVPPRRARSVVPQRPLRSPLSPREIGRPRWQRDPMRLAAMRRSAGTVLMPRLR